MCVPDLSHQKVKIILYLQYNKLYLFLFTYVWVLSVLWFILRY